MNSRDRYVLAGKRVWVAGHRGMVGAAMTRRLAREDVELLTIGRDALDLRDQAATRDWVAAVRPQVIYLAAAKVGGIHANNRYPADFIFDNLTIETNVIDAAFRAGVEKLVFLGSTCIYPKNAPQPTPEEALLTGPLEPTNEWYAIAKIAGLKLCQAYRRQYGCDFIAVQPTNLYGPGDSYDLENSHVLPALLRKAHDAKLGQTSAMSVWGTGKPKREFLHVDDLADALVFLTHRYSEAMPINIGSGEEVTIAELARLICAAVGYRGAIEYDDRRPDGMERKLCNLTRLHSLGWRHRIALRDGIEDAYRDFLDQQDAAAGMVQPPRLDVH
jgi:GDP-L-fucose synthase